MLAPRKKYEKKTKREARGRKGGETREGKEMRGVGGQVRASVGNRTQDLISIKIWFCQS